MKSILADIVLKNIEFLSLAPDSDIHPDVAVRQLEIISSRLKELSETELKTFLNRQQNDLRSFGLKALQTNSLSFLKTFASIWAFRFSGRSYHHQMPATNGNNL